VTADGRYVAFQPRAAGIVPGDPDGSTGFFDRGCQDQVTEPINIDSAGATGSIFAFSGPTSRYRQASA